MASNRKYEIVNTYNWNGKIIKQIRALRSFGNIKKNSIGGWIESESNLSHEGNCWITDGCIVCGDTKVTGDIIVRNYLRFLHTVDQETLTIKPLRKNGWDINYSGFDKISGEHYVKVGCQFHSISRWKDAEVRKRIMSRNRFPKEYEQEFLEILAEIEKKYVLNPFKKIEENVESLKKNVTEELKTETISLINSLKIAPVVSKGPQRDKFGRFMKKTP